MPTKRLADPIEYLLQGAVWQDGLLQSYRLIYLTLQAIFLATATGLSVLLFQIETPLKLKFALAGLIVLIVVSVVVLILMCRVVLARGEDVSYWHCELVKAEQGLPPDERYFTLFKLHQRIRRKRVEDLKELFLAGHPRTLKEAEIQRLIGRGLSHTRKILDVILSSAILLMWGLISGLVIYVLLARFS